MTDVKKRRTRNSWAARAAIAAACLTLAFLEWAPIWTNSYVFNESGRIASGLIILQRADFSSFRVNPPLANALSAVPAALSGKVRAPRREKLDPGKFGRVEYAAGAEFVRRAPNHRLYLRLGRLCMLPFGFLGCAVCFYYGRFLYGFYGGLIACFLWTFSPYVLGYGATVGSDVPSAALALAAVALFHYWLRTRNSGVLPALGALLGVAQLCKFTLLALYPLLILFWLLSRALNRRRRGGSGAGAAREARELLVWVFGLSLLVLNMGYLFDGTFKPLGEYRFRSVLLSGRSSPTDDPQTAVNRFSGTALGITPVPLPEDYVLGIDAQRFDFERGLPSYLRGQWSDRGWARYYLYALAVKTPVGALAIFALALCVSLRKRYRASALDETVLLGTGAAFLLLVSSQTGFSVHSRYVLPALPFFFVAAGRLGRAFERPTRERRILVGAVALCGLWSAASVLIAYPDRISYFNELTPILAGDAPKVPEPAPRARTAFGRALERYRRKIALAAPTLLLDSNFDWGQDAYRLDAWLRSRPDVSAVTTRLQSNGDTLLRKINPAVLKLTDKSESQWFAVSAAQVYNRREGYRWLWGRKPDAMIGATVYVYHVDAERAWREFKEKEDAQ